jgi:hypothetical protein
MALVELAHPHDCCHGCDAAMVAPAMAIGGP